jgi:hypothetical protein
VAIVAQIVFRSKSVTIKSLRFLPYGVVGYLNWFAYCYKVVASPADRTPETRPLHTADFDVPLDLGQARHDGDAGRKSDGPKEKADRPAAAILG